jgi:hypothetical protein
VQRQLVAGCREGLARCRRRATVVDVVMEVDIGIASTFREVWRWSLMELGAKMWLVSQSASSGKGLDPGLQG